LDFLNLDFLNLEEGEGEYFRDRKMTLLLQEKVFYSNPYNKVLIIDYCRAEPFLGQVTKGPLAQSAVVNIGVLRGGTPLFSTKIY
jgi:hypothetical protein